MLKDSLIDYWPLDEVSGDATGAHASKPLIDEGGVGSNTGLVYALAREFEGGLTEILYRNDASDLHFGDEDFTIMAWFYQYTTPPVLYHYIIQNETFDGGHAIALNGLGEVFFTCGYGGGGTDTIHLATPVPVNNTWHLVFAWYVASTDTMYLSIDNGAASSQVMTSPKTAGSMPWTRFGYGGSADNTMDGRIGPMAMWSRVLSSDEMTALWNDGDGLAYESFDPSTNLVVADAAHAQAADNIALTQIHALVVADAAHAQAAENVALVVNLAVADATHAQTTDPVTLTQQHTLAIFEARHVQIADPVTLTGIPISLVVQEARHGQMADGLTLVEFRDYFIFILFIARSHVVDGYITQSVDVESEL